MEDLTEPQLRARASWYNMKAQCRRDKVKYHKRWETFEGFLLDMGGRPEDKILTRRNPRWGYTPKNCVYAKRKAAHTRREWNRMVTWRGIKRNAFEWARVLKMNPTTVVTRLRRGWSVSEAFTRRPRGRT